MLKTLVWDRRTAVAGATGAAAGEAAASRQADTFRELADVRQAGRLVLDDGHLVWIDVTAPSPEELRLLAEEFSLHPLAVEDAAKHAQRPKIDEYDNFYLMVVFAIEPVAMAEDGAAGTTELISTGTFTIHEIDLFIGHRFLITVHEQALPLLDQVGERWHHNSRAIDEGIGVLVYTLLDSVVDAYFPVLDDVVERVETLEEHLFADVVTKGKTYDMRSLFQIKKDLLHLRRVIAPERDALLVLARQEIPLFDRKVAVYFQDVYDHVVRVTDAIDIYQDLLTNALESYLSLVSNNLNQVMKTLTALTVIMAVPTVIAGIYGMNFENMPELKWGYGYAYALGLMVLAVAVVFLYFRRKRWI